jgi:GxxExxY protein
LVQRWKSTTCSALAYWSPRTKNVWRASSSCEEFTTIAKKVVPVVYKDVKLDCGYRIDLVLEGQVVVELKAVENVAKIHAAIVLTYLRLSGCRIGLLINFNVFTLKQGIRRCRI